MQAYDTGNQDDQDEPHQEAQMHYHLDIEMYDNKPTHIMELEHLEQICTDRLALLHRIYYLIEMSSEEGVVHIDRDQTFKIIESEERKRNLKTVGGRNYLSIENDAVSHWMLMLGLSRSEDLQRFFLNQETRLFKIRLMSLKKSNQSAYQARLREYAERRFDHPTPDIIKISEEFKKFERESARKAKIADALFSEDTSDAYFYDYFYAVPHTMTTLFQDRTVQVKAGYAIVPLYKIQSLMLNEFRQKLAKRIEIAHKHFPAVVAKDVRMKEILLRMNDQYIGPDYGEHESKGMAGSGLKINLAQLQSVANSTSYPPCMKVLHTKLMQNHHLRHFGRLQYGLYLKGIGLTLKESLDFWKGEFCKKIPIQKFEKDYAYNIRHSYGKEGKRVDYTPWTCDTILHKNAPVSQNEFHGCPFKNYDAGSLLKVLDSYGVSASQMTNIMKLKTGKEYQRACLHLFKYTHPDSTPENVGNHPVAYLSSSLEYKNTNKRIQVAQTD